MACLAISGEGIDRGGTITFIDFSTDRNPTTLTVRNTTNIPVQHGKCFYADAACSASQEFTIDVPGTQLRRRIRHEQRDRATDRHGERARQGEHTPPRRASPVQGHRSTSASHPWQRHRVARGLRRHHQERGRLYAPVGC